MANLNKKINPCFNTEVGEYLEANGFTDMTEANEDRITYVGSDVSIIIKNDRVDIVQYYDGDDDRLQDMKRIASYTGISSLSLFDWMLLLHISKVVPIKKFMAAVKKEEPGNTTLDMLQSLFSHFKITDDKNALPLGY